MAWWFSGSKAIINVMSVWQTGLEREGVGYTEGYTRVRMGLQPMRLHNRYLAYTCATHKCAPVHHTRPRWTRRLKKVIRGRLSSAIFVYLPLLLWPTVTIDDSTFDLSSFCLLFATCLSVHFPKSCIELLLSVLVPFGFVFFANVSRRGGILLSKQDFSIFF